VQNLLELWHAQSGQQGVCGMPRVLLIQINRFDMQAGIPNKSSRQVLINPYIKVPNFPADLTQPHAMEVGFLRFRRTAALLHEGQSPTTGHYRAVLYEDKRMFITDDKVPARLLQANASNQEYIQTRVYAVLYVHCADA